MAGTSSTTATLDGRASPTQTALRKGSGASQIASPVPSATASTKQNFKRPHLPSHVTDFNIEKTKFRVFKAIEDKAPPKFRTFFKSSLMDRFLQATLLYFISRFQHQVCMHSSSVMYWNHCSLSTWSMMFWQLPSWNLSNACRESKRFFVLTSIQIDG